MPRNRPRALLLKYLEEQHASRQDLARRDALLNIPRCETDAFIDLLVATRLRRVQASRYLDRPLSYRKYDYTHEMFQRILEMERFNHEEFLQHFRLSRQGFSEVLSLIEGHEVFRNDSKHPQAPTAHQLLVFLKCVGTSGNGHSTISIKAMFDNKLGKGTVSNFCTRTEEAVLALKSQAVVWPSQIERVEIAARILEDYGFPNCVGIADGTLMPLVFKPTLNGADYCGRKVPYSLNVLIINDDVSRIRYFIAGWPGTAHDNRIWRNCNMARNGEEFMNACEYILGNSAFQSAPNMLPNYKKPNGAVMPAAHEFYNTCAAKPRVKSEHTIGLLKNRFQYLKGIRTVIAGSRDMKAIIKTITACIILHNLLIKDPVPKEWTERDDDFEKDFDELDDTDELNNEVPIGADPGTRREQVLGYLMERFTFVSIE